MIGCESERMAAYAIVPEPASDDSEAARGDGLCSAIYVCRTSQFCGWVLDCARKSIFCAAKSDGWRFCYAPRRSS